MIMNWSFTKFTKSLIRFVLRYFTWVKSFRVFNNFQYTKPVGNGFFNNYVFHQKLDKNSTFIFPEAISTMILTLCLLSNCFLLHFGVHWRLCAGHSFQYFLNKIFRHYFFDLTFFSETDQFVAGPRTDN